MWADLKEQKLVQVKPIEIEFPFRVARWDKKEGRNQTCCKSKLSRCPLNLPKKKGKSELKSEIFQTKIDKSIDVWLKHFLAKIQSEN